MPHLGQFLTGILHTHALVRRNAWFLYWTSPQFLPQTLAFNTPNIFRYAKCLSYSAGQKILGGNMEMILFSNNMRHQISDESLASNINVDVYIRRILDALLH